MGWDVQHALGKEAVDTFCIGIMKGRDPFDMSEVNRKVT
jgi:hypothetical protein